MHMNNDRREVHFDICSYFVSANLKNLLKNSGLLPSSSLAAVFISILAQFTKKIKETCEKTHKNSLRQRGKDRYQSASLTVEAAVAFPVFFFAVLYLIQMFSVLRAEVVIAEAGITSAREIAAYSYAAKRLAEGEHAVADKLLELFDQKIVQDATMTGVFYARCDQDVLKEGNVAEGFGGIWVSTEEAGDKTQAKIRYLVNPVNVWKEEKGRYYVMRLVYRPWTGTGGMQGDVVTEEAASEEVVYMTEHGRVYHTRKNCSYIEIDVRQIDAWQVDKERNQSGAKYYACEFCRPEGGSFVYITEYGTRYHALSSCSAIERNAREVALEKVKDSYRCCSKCSKAKEGK